MRVLVPILITALWASLTVKIDGVWPPTDHSRSLSSIGEPLENTAHRVLASLQDDIFANANPNPLGSDSSTQVKRDLSRKIALPRLPSVPRRPVCG